MAGVEMELVERLQGELGLEEIFQVTLCYHLTRQGARGTYLQI